MRKSLSVGLAFTPAFLVSAAIVACSGTDAASTFPNGDNGSGDHPPASGPNNPGGPGALFGNDAGFTSVDSGGGGGCATSSAAAKQVPVYLVFMFDRSGSMSENQKWVTCKAGLESFFGDPQSQGLFASIQFFANLTDECNVASYSTPAVAMTALPANSFASTIDTFSPNAGTPTLPALKGAIAYAQQQQLARPGQKVAVVLATDGIPNDCNSDVPSVAAEAATVASTIPTYVIGVGDQLQALDDIAAGGGTGKALVVSVGDPAKTATDFQAALATIRGKSLSCSYTIPAPPAGEKLDINNVNVQFTPSSGAPSVLTYNASCAGGTGWHYDNTAAPTQIEMCATSCTTVQADAGGKIDIVLGCATQGGVTK